jgi:dipeptidyl aminopeptidase/acylaminoacyl peptidase
MKRLVFALVVGLSVVAAGHAWAQPAAKASSIERFMKIRAAAAPTIAPDGTLYVRDWPDGVWQLYRVEGKEARPDAKMTALTSFRDGLAGYSLSYDGGRALLLHAVGGNENTQVSLLDVKSGAITPLLANPKVQHAVNLWLRDDSGFVYTANDESPNDFYLYKYDFSIDRALAGKQLEAFQNMDGRGTRDEKILERAAAKSSVLLLSKPGSWSAGDVTQDASRFLVHEERSASDSSMYELDAKTGKLTDLTTKGSEPTVSVDIVGYMPGEASILFTSDIENGLRKLFMRDLKTGQITKPVSELESFELDSAGMNREKTLLTAVTNEDGYGVLHMYRLPTFERVTLPPMEKGVVSVNELRANHLVYTLSNARTPGVAFAYDIPEKGKEAPGPTAAPTQITFADTQGIDFSRFALPRLIKYKSFDGLEIPAFVFTPANAFGADGKPRPIPFVVNYHGGPEGQTRPGFDKVTQYLVSEGFGVIQPNVRGSSGYGRAFLMMDDYKKRWDSVKDGVAAAAWLVDNGYSTPGKIATYGGSYGGFMSVACLVEDQQQVDAGVRKQRLFGAGVDVVGIVNMRTFLEQTSGYRRKLREVEYGPLSDPEFLDSISSIKKVDKINVPMFIAHGFNDPRVPVGEAMQLSMALKERAIKEKHLENMPHLFIAPDEGHGFQKLNNRLYFYEYMAAFLKQTIGKETVKE